MSETYIYIAVMAIVTYLIRVLPLTLIRREIKNVTLRSFLYYVPYVTLSVMTFPAMMESTGSQWSGLAAFIAAGVFAALLFLRVYRGIADRSRRGRQTEQSPDHQQQTQITRYAFGGQSFHHPNNTITTAAISASR